MTEERRDWRELCAAVASEKDRSKLLELVEELVAALDRRESDSTKSSAATAVPRTVWKRGGVIAFPVKRIPVR
jgi:hypothetical protein